MGGNRRQRRAQTGPVARSRSAPLRLETLLDNLPGMAYRCRNDRAWTMELVSQGCATLTGHLPEALVDGSVHYGDLIHGDDRERVWGEVQQALAAGEAFEVEYRLRRADGQLRWVWERGRASEDLIEGFITDIDARHHAEERALALFEWSPLPTYIWRDHGDGLRLTGFNRAAKAETDRPLVDCYGVSTKDFFAHQPEICALLEDCYQKKSHLRETRSYHYAKSGEVRELVIHGGYLPPDALIISTEDVTEQQALQRQLQLAQKMEAVGRLAGGIAHDFNNMLTAIAGFTESMLHDERSDEDREDLGQIHRAIGRASKLAKQLLTLGRRDQAQTVTLDLNKVITNSRQLLGQVLGEEVLLRLRLGREALPILGDPVQLEQLLLNLTINARDAMEEGGCLIIESGVESFAAARGGAGAGRYACVRIRDDGVGIPPDDLPHVFEPFFTTKEAGRGTGLGLATVYSVVRRAGGTVELSSDVGEGTTVSIYLPLGEESVDAQTPTPTQSGGRQQGSGTVLIVEDDRLLRDMLTRMLKDAGYRVVVAKDGHEALSQIECTPAVDILLTDVGLPRLSGPELAERLSARRSPIPVIFMTGHDAEQRRSLLPENAILLTKPFTLDRLLKVLHEARESHPDPPPMLSEADVREAKRVV